MDGVVELWELCGFNPSCNAKYRRLGMHWQDADLGLQSEAETAALLAVAPGRLRSRRDDSLAGNPARLEGLAPCAFGPSQADWTGLTRFER
jgi:hypothetical protein